MKKITPYFERSKGDYGWPVPAAARTAADAKLVVAEKYIESPKISPNRSFIFTHFNEKLRKMGLPIDK